ncbi:MAG: hypothetical protein HFF98_00490 [Oscillibacter sp.]|nr:hypothetical protein [Oscillibacter sp.]MCI9577303.1 hypothetical protein [Oscillibacter sp.]
MKSSKSPTMPNFIVLYNSFIFKGFGARRSRAPKACRLFEADFFAIGLIIAQDSPFLKTHSLSGVSGGRPFAVPRTAVRTARSIHFGLFALPALFRRFSRIS